MSGRRHRGGAAVTAAVGVVALGWSAIPHPVTAQPPPCPNDAPGATCLIQGQVINFEEPYSWTLNGSLVLQDCVVTQVVCNVLPYCPEGTLTMTMGGSVTFVNTSVYVPSFTVLADNITVDIASALVADGTGPTSTQQTGPGGDVDGVSGTGGGHGGAGSNIAGCHNNVPPGKPGGQGFGFSNVSFPFHFGGSSSGFGPGRLVTPSRGGGRIWLEAVDTLFIAGVVSANGADGVEAFPGCFCGPGGGGGGSVFAAATLININSSGLISVVGGNSMYTGGGGGGIASLWAFTILGATSTAVNVSGGATMDTLQFGNCPLGGTGLYARQELFNYAERVPPTSVAAPRSAYLRRHPRSHETAVFHPVPNRVRRDDAMQVWRSCLAVMAATRPLSIRQCPTITPLDWGAMTGGGVRPARAAPLPHRGEEAWHGVHDPWTGRWIDMSGARARHAALVLEQDPTMCDYNLDSDERACYLSHPDLIPPHYAQTYLCHGETGEEAATAGGLPPSLPPPPLRAGTNFSSLTVLTCVSGVLRSSKSPLTETIVDSLTSVDNVVMTGCAWDISLIPSVFMSTWKMASSALEIQSCFLTFNGSVSIQDYSRIYTASTSDLMSIQAMQPISVLLSLLSTGFITITTPSVLTINTQAYIRFAFQGSVTSNTLCVGNALTQTDIPPTTTSLFIKAGNMSSGSSAQVNAGIMSIIATDMMNVQGSWEVDNSFSGSPTCPAQPQGSWVPAITPIACTNAAAFPNSGFMAWLQADTILLQKTANVFVPALRVCARDLIIQDGATLSASEIGCNSQTGFGTGTSSVGIPASGAGHGGIGGDGVAGNGNTLPGGASYDNLTAPVMLGSGGGDTTLGGTGGGIMYVDVANVFINSGSVRAVAADGLPATLNGGGGGSGGSGVFTMSNLTGAASGLFDFSGGDGGAPGGGGGGGGVLNVMWYDGSSPQVLALRQWYRCLVRRTHAMLVDADGTSDACLWEVGLRHGDSALVAPQSWLLSGVGRSAGNSFQGSLYNDGGQGSTPGQDGSYGAALSIPTCNLGEGDALCLPCQLGQFKNTSGDNLPCTPCPAGLFSNVTGSSNCTVCDEHSVAPMAGSSQCTACDPGFLPDPAHITCSLCQPGYGSVLCKPCQPGTAKNTTSTKPCTECPPGTSAAESGMLQCQPCGPGRYYPDKGAIKCNTCAPGTVSQSPYITCYPCPPGSAADPDSNTCQICPPGSSAGQQSPTCFPCDVGDYSFANSSTCMKCPPKPANSDWQRPPNYQWQRWWRGGQVHDPPSNGSAIIAYFCAFLCKPGYVLSPRCVTPLAAAYIAAGGLPGILSAALLALLVTIVPAFTKFRPPPQAASLYAWVPDAEMSSTGPVAGRIGGNTEVEAYFGAVSYDRLLMHRRGRGPCGGLCARCWCGDAAKEEAMDDVGAMAEGWAPLQPTSSSVNSAAISAALEARQARSTSPWSGDHRRGRARTGGERGDGLEASLLTGRGSRGHIHHPSAAAYHTRAFSSLPAGVDDAMATASASARQQYPVLVERDDAPPTLALSELSRHLHRLYFVGTNSPAQPLRLEPHIPPELLAAVSEHEFYEHADDIGEVGRWQWWEVRVANVLRLVYHPVALWWERARRKAHVTALAKRYADFDHSFLRNTRARALGNCVKFGHSRDFTLAWIDVLVSDVMEDVGGAPVGKPHLPAVLPLAGDGSFMCPYHVDLCDSVTVAHLALLAPDFHSIVLGLNNLLRRFRGPTLSPGLMSAPRHEDESAEAGRGSEMQMLSSQNGGYTSPSLAHTTYGMSTWANHAPGPGGGLDAMASVHDTASVALPAGAGAPVVDGGGSVVVVGEDGEGTPSHGIMGARGACCSGYAQNNAPEMENQRQLRTVDEYVKTVNALLASRWREGLAALQLLRRAQQAGAMAITTDHTHGLVEVTALAAGRKWSFPLSSHTSSMGGSMLGGLLPLLVPPDSPDAPDAPRPAGGGDEVDPEDVERALAALQLVPFGFPHVPVSMHLGKMHRDHPNPAVAKPCLLLVPAGIAPNDEGLFPIYLPYNARALRVNVMQSMFGGLAMMPSRHAIPSAGGRGGVASMAGAGALTASNVHGGAGQRLAAANPPSAAAPVPLGVGMGMRLEGGRPTSLRALAVGTGTGGAPYSPTSRPQSTRCPDACGLQCSGWGWVVATAGHYMPALRNSRASSSWEVITLALSLLQCLNVTVTTLVASGMLTLTSHIGPIVMIIPPAVYILAPICGCMAVGMSNPMLHRIAASLELHALIPTAIVVVAGIIGTVMGPFDYQLGIIFPLALAMIKLAVLRLTNIRVALLDLYLDARHSHVGAVAYVRELLADSAKAGAGAGAGAANVLTGSGVPGSAAGGGSPADSRGAEGGSSGEDGGMPADAGRWVRAATPPPPLPPPTPSSGMAGLGFAASGNGMSVGWGEGRGGGGRTGFYGPGISGMSALLDFASLGSPGGDT